jgi:hypothetical protein
LRSLSCRIKGHIEFWEHLGMGRLSCNAIDLCYRQLIKTFRKSQGGVLKMGRMKQTKSRMKRKPEERNSSCILTWKHVLLSGFR